MLPAISQFLKGTFDESLKKLVQPAGLVVSGIFILLNLFFIFPPLAAQNNQFVMGFLRLEEGWQIVVMIAAIIVLAYLLLSLNASVMRIMTGELWGGSPLLGGLGRAMQKRQLGPLDEECERVRELRADSMTPDDVQTLYYCWDRITRYPARSAYLAPTALGNVLNSTADYVQARYNIDMTALWPQMEIVLAGSDKGKALNSRIEDEKATLNFLVNLSFVLALFVVEYLLLNTFWFGLLWPPSWPALALSAAVLLTSYIVYRASVTKARSWGEAVQMAFDMHRSDLAAALKLRPSRDRADERKLWKGISEWLVWWPKYSRSSAHPDDLFETPSAASAPSASLLVQSGNASVKSFETVVEERVPPENVIGNAVELREHINYELIVSNTSQDKPAQGVSFVVADPRVPSIRESDLTGPYEPVSYPPTDVELAIVPSGEGKPAHYLSWQVNNVAPNSAVTIRYKLPGDSIFRAETNHDKLLILQSLVEPNKGLGPGVMTYTFKFINVGVEPITNGSLLVRDGRIDAADEVPQGLAIFFNAPVPAWVVAERLWRPDRYRWPLGNIPAGETLVLTYSAGSVKRGA